MPAGAFSWAATKSGVASIVFAPEVACAIVRRDPKRAKNNMIGVSNFIIVLPNFMNSPCFQALTMNVLGMSDVCRWVNNDKRRFGSSHSMGTGPNGQGRELLSRIPVNPKRISGQGYPVGRRGGSQVMQRGFCPIPAYRLQSKRNDLHGETSE